MEKEKDPPGVHPGSQLLGLLPRLLPLLSILLGLCGDGAVRHDVHDVLLQREMLLQGTTQTLCQTVQRQNKINGRQMIQQLKRVVLNFKKPEDNFPLTPHRLKRHHNFKLQNDSVCFSQVEPTHVGVVKLTLMAR